MTTVARQSRSRARAVLFGIALSGVVHCGTSDDVGVRSEAGDAGASVEPDDATSPTSEDGGTSDSGSTDASFTVCGGSKGDPSAVPLLDWAVYNNPWKYKVLLGASAPEDEPASFSSTLVVANGTLWQGIYQTVSAIAGGGPFGSEGPLSKSRFVENAMPVTEPLSKSLGWTSFNESVFDVRTKLAKPGWDHFRVAGSAAHFTALPWTLIEAKQSGTTAGPDHPNFVRTIVPAHGFGWFFTVAFDHACKATAFDALVGENALSILDPLPPITRADVSRFLVQNDARLFLTVATYGAEDPNIKAALVGTQASSTSLDALDATMTALVAAIDAYSKNAAAPTYESVTSATNPTWVIGAVGYDTIESLPPP